MTLTTLGERTIIVSPLASLYMTEMECFQGVNAAVDVYLPLDRRVGKPYCKFYNVLINLIISTFHSYEL